MLGDEGAHLLGVGGVIEHDDDRRPREVLLVLLAQPLEVLLLRGPFAEEQLLARGAQPVEQMQQRLPCGQRRFPLPPPTATLRGTRFARLCLIAAAQRDHARAAELVAQLVRRAHRERAAARSCRPVQQRSLLREGRGRCR